LYVFAVLSLEAAASASSSTHTYSLRLVADGDDMMYPMYSGDQPVGHRVFPGCISTVTLPGDWHTAHGTSSFSRYHSRHSASRVVAYSARYSRDA
jgi:hypothetical protein